MFDHTGLSVSDFDKARIFYDSALAPLGASLLFMVPPEHTGGVRVGGYGTDRPRFWLHEDGAQTPPLHVAFAASSRADVDAFHARALAGGDADNGPPGLRPHYHENYYGAFVNDSDGNNIEAVCHRPE
jgi:catechol 2,3-dioxygenase-like lactoylglutathione lyase family enzyme